MATLEEAAQELVDRLEELDGECQEAQETLAGHLRGLSELDAGMAREWDALTAAVTSFLERVQEQAGLVAEDGTEAANELGGVRGEVEGAQGTLTDEIAGARAELSALGEHLRSLEPALETVVASGGEAPLAALRAQAESVREQLDEMLGETGDFLDDVASELGELAQGVAERSESLRAQVAEECSAQLQTGFDNWQGHVDELEELVRAKLAELPVNAREVVEWAMGECVAGHEEELERVMALLPSVEQALAELKVTIEESVTDIGEEALGAVDDRLGTLSQSITRTGEALDAVREVLASYTFVTM